MNDIQNRADIDGLMLRFYELAMKDDVIGFIFTDTAKLDLDRHLPVIGDFWETIVFQVPVYAQHGRNPLQVHGALDDKTMLLPEHFARWQQLFYESVDAMFAGERADFIKLRADAIASRMSQFVSSKHPDFSHPRVV